jgi:hypothetical protein
MDMKDQKRNLLLRNGERLVGAIRYISIQGKHSKPVKIWKSLILQVRIVKIEQQLMKPVDPPD